MPVEKTDSFRPCAISSEKVSFGQKVPFILETFRLGKSVFRTKRSPPGVFRHYENLFEILDFRFSDVSSSEKAIFKPRGYLFGYFWHYVNSTSFTIGGP